MVPRGNCRPVVFRPYPFASSRLSPLLLSHPVREPAFPTHGTFPAAVPVRRTAFSTHGTLPRYLSRARNRLSHSRHSSRRRSRARTRLSHSRHVLRRRSRARTSLSHSRNATCRCLRAWLHSAAPELHAEAMLVLLSGKKSCGEGEIYSKIYAVRWCYIERISIYLQSV